MYTGGAEGHCARDFALAQDQLGCEFRAS
jgi:hypothetical protein